MTAEYRIHVSLYPMNLHTFPVKSKLVNAFNSAGLKVSTPLWCENNNRQYVNEWTWEHFNKLYLQEQVVGQIWPLHSLPSSVLHQQLPSRKRYRK